MFTYRHATHSAVFAVVRCPSVCHVDVSKRQILLSNFFIASWPHHSSFPKGTVKFRRGHPQQGRQIEVGYTKNFRFLTIFQKYRYRIPRYFKIPNRHEKIPTKIPNTDTDSKYRYRPSCHCPSDQIFVLFIEWPNWWCFVFTCWLWCIQQLCGHIVLQFVLTNV